MSGGDRRPLCPAPLSTVVGRHTGRWMTKLTMEGLMSPAAQAFIMTWELFVLSFAAIFAVWFADKLRRNFFGQP
jgi:hypothetical protein